MATDLELVSFGTLGAAAAGILFVDGRPKTLDASADGYVRSTCIETQTAANTTSTIGAHIQNVSRCT